MALDSDGERVVDDLAEINWLHEHDGRVVIRMAAPPVVVQQGHGWATVLLALDERKGGGWVARYVVTRWKRDRGAWRLYDRFRLSLEALRGVALAAPPLIAHVVGRSASSE